MVNQEPHSMFNQSPTFYGQPTDQFSMVNTKKTHFQWSTEDQDYMVNYFLWSTKDLTNDMSPASCGRLLTIKELM
jgi:hypothetical protein